jgi:hypothetical protein
MVYNGGFLWGDRVKLSKYELISFVDNVLEDKIQGSEFSRNVKIKLLKGKKWK